MNFKNKIGPQDAQMQMTPMMDVIFLLLIFFLCTSIYHEMETELSIQLPTADAGQAAQRLPGEIIVNIAEDGRIVVNTQPMELKELADVLKRIAETYPGQAVIIRGDTKAQLGKAVEVLNACAAADIWNVSFATVDRASAVANKPQP